MTTLRAWRALTTTTLMLVLGVASALDVPHIFSEGDVISAAEMNENFAAVGASIASIGARLAPDPLPALMVRRSGQSTPNLALTPVVFSDVVLDTDDLFDPGTPNQLRSSVAGLYHITVHVSWEANASGTRTVVVNQGGTAVLVNGAPAQATGLTRLETTGLLVLAADAPVVVLVRHTSGGPLEATTRADLVWLGHLP